MISVSIIVPAWNEERTLKATLEALSDVDYDKKKCEVIVAAGGDDSTYESARALSTTMEMFSRYMVILQEPQGKNAAIQQCIKEARNEIIVLLDADTTVSARWLKSMVRPIEEGGCDLTIANPEPVISNWVSSYYVVTKAYFLDRIITYSGHSIAFKTSMVENRLEYFFDKEIKVGVDYLLAKRFLEQGRKIMFVKDASVITHLPSSLKYFVLSESRWLTGLIHIDGFHYRTLACNTAVVAALIFAIPLSKTMFILALLVNVTYIVKRTLMFLRVSKHCHTKILYLFGFLMLSYTYHVIGFISHIKYFLGLSKGIHLSQGQRY